MPLELPVLFRQGFSSPSSYPVEVHNGDIDAQRSKIRFDQVGPNELPIWRGRRVKNAIAGSWQQYSTSGQTLTLVHNAAVGPDGQMTASRLTMARTSSGILIYTWAGFVTATLPVGAPYTAAITMRTADGSTQRVGFSGPQNQTLVTVDGTWRRYAQSGPVAGPGAGYCRALLYAGADLSCDLLIAMDPGNCPQLELGALTPGEPTHWGTDYGWGMPGARWFSTKAPASVHATSLTVAYSSSPDPIPDIEGIQPLPPYTMNVLNSALQNGSYWGWSSCSFAVASIAGPMTGLAPGAIVEVNPTTVTYHRISQAASIASGSMAWGLSMVRAANRTHCQFLLHNSSDGNIALTTFNLTTLTASAAAGSAFIEDMGDSWRLIGIVTASRTTNTGTVLYLSLHDGASNLYTASDGLVGLQVAYCAAGNGLVPQVIVTSNAAVSILADTNQIPTSTPATLRWTGLVEFWVPSPALGSPVSSYTANPRLLAGESGAAHSLAYGASEVYLQDGAGNNLSTVNSSLMANAVNRAVVVVNPPLTRIFVNGQLAAEGSFNVAKPFSRVGYAPGTAYGQLGVRAYRYWPDYAMPMPMAALLSASGAL